LAQVRGINPLSAAHPVKIFFFESIISLVFSFVETKQEKDYETIQK